MRLLIYVSEYTGTQEALDDTLAGIRRISKERNDENQITGILFYENGTFLQAVEGPEQSIDNLMDRLQEDPRHRNLEILVQIEIDERYFQQWNMDSINLEQSDLFTADVLKKLRDAYMRNIELTDANFVMLIQDMLNTPGVEAILNQ